MISNISHSRKVVFQGITPNCNNVVIEKSKKQKAKQELISHVIYICMF